MFLFGEKFRFGVYLVALACAGVGMGRAEGVSPAFTFEPGKTAFFPEWLQPVGTASELDTTVSRTSFDVSPPSGTGNLILTVVFDSGEGRFLRVYTQSLDGSRAETLAENLDERTGFAGSRTLLIPFSGMTRIVFQSNAGDGVASIRRLVWEWADVRSLPVVALPGQIGDAAAGALRGSVVFPLSDVDGSPSLSPAALVTSGMTRTALLDRPTRFGTDDPATFDAVIDRLPSAARLSGKVLGLPPEQELECRINGVRVGTFSAPAPALDDPGYLPGTGTLAAWRAGAVYLPARFLHAGENVIELVPAGTDAGGSVPFALKDLSLECAYAPTGTAAP
ncbi:hypothetical protein SAMN05444156_1758 [Verrucomicrobium sp. GAS474]|uniref:hypothetical protein n=1 Tax=Verrucomicrobium sp. GAS474 TaxID=1882831 RepID=UPI00087D75F8|nr:hypothetical protein [Verrucomicrobium sp. GAS474]SDU06531.1 hypothetical protein SAMN05444156_1758 [Verrucomicrobium sp. GAS474]